MIKVCKYNQNSILEQIKNGKLDAIALSNSNLIDNIILKMNDITLLIGYAITKQNLLDLHIEFGILNGFEFNCKFIN